MVMVLMSVLASASCEWDFGDLVPIHTVALTADDWVHTSELRGGDTVWTYTADLDGLLEGFSDRSTFVLRVTFEDEVVVNGRVPDAYDLHIGPRTRPDREVLTGPGSYGITSRTTWSFGDDGTGLAWLDDTTASLVSHAEAWMGWALVGDHTRCLEIMYHLTVDPEITRPEQVVIETMSLQLRWEDGDWREHEPLRIRPWDQSLLFRQGRESTALATSAFEPFTVYAGRPGADACLPELDGECLDLTSPRAIAESDGGDIWLGVSRLTPGTAIELQAVEDTDEGLHVLAPLTLVTR